MDGSEQMNLEANGLEPNIKMKKLKTKRSYSDEVDEKRIMGKYKLVEIVIEES